MYSIEVQITTVRWPSTDLHHQTVTVPYAGTQLTVLAFFYLGGGKSCSRQKVDLVLGIGMD